MERHRRLDRAAAGALSLALTLLADAALAQPAEECDEACALMYWGLLLTEPSEAEARPETQPKPALRSPLSPQGDCGLNCARGYLHAVEDLRRTDPTGTQIYDRLTFKKQPTGKPALRPTGGRIQALTLTPKPAQAPASGRLASLKVRPKLNPKPPAKPLTFKVPPKRKPLTFQQMLLRAPKKPARLLAPRPVLAAASQAPARPQGDLGGPKDRTACNQGNAEACNRVGRVYWDQLKPPAHDKAQIDTLRAAKTWYGKACEAGKETACWEAIGLLQRLDKARPVRIGF